MPHGEFFLHPNCHVCIASVFAGCALGVLEHAHARWAAQAAGDPNATPTASLGVGAAGAWATLLVLLVLLLLLPQVLQVLRLLISFAIISDQMHA